MTAHPGRSALRRGTRFAIAGIAILAAAHGASASEGMGDFFSSIFGGAPQPAPAIQRLPAEDVSSGAPLRLRASRPHALTVRLHPAKPRLAMSDKPARPGKVSIFEDRTLRRGDAVMTAHGIRIFAGSASWPYTADDFVGLDDAKQLSRDTTKVLAQLDKLPRG